MGCDSAGPGTGAKDPERDTDFSSLCFRCLWFLSSGQGVFRSFLSFVSSLGRAVYFLHLMFLTCAAFPFMETVRWMLVSTSLLLSAE